MKIKKDFHSRLFGFAGFSGAGKTTLIEKIISRMSERHQIGYVKHDSHKFEMDHPGKDTFRQFKAGASVVYINDRTHYAIQGRGESFNLEREFFKDCDFVIVEGHKYSDHPKFLFLDEDGLAESEFRAGKITSVVGTISQDEKYRLDDLPHFHRDNIEGICAFLSSRIEETVQKAELCGLVLAGGQSTRMGQDKSLLRYHRKPQALHLYELLEDLGLKTFLSCRRDQESGHYGEINLINDRFLNFGPLGGILSAMTEHPEKAFLVAACDLPLITKDHIQNLILERDPLRQATAFFNGERKMFEPLFTIYEPHAYSRLMHFLGQRVTCPQKVLFNSSIKRLELPAQDFLFNANTPEEGKAALEFLEGRKL